MKYSKYSFPRSLVGGKIRVMKPIGVIVLALFLGVSPASASAQEAYFSPNGHVRDRAIEEISNAEESIDIAVYNITSAGLRTALKQAQKKGVSIRIITDQGESEDSH